MSGAGYVKEYKLDQALARIAELEAERLILHDKCNGANRELGGLRIDYVKLEAERDRLKAALEPFVSFMERQGYHDDYWADDDMAGSGISVGDLRRARAALSAARIAELEAEQERTINENDGAKIISGLEQALDYAHGGEDARISNVFVPRSSASEPNFRLRRKLEAQWAHTVDALRAASERIAELEVENVLIMATDKRLISENTQLANDSIVAKARIAELEAELLRYEKLLLDREAERDRLKARLASLVRYCDYRREQTGGGEPPELVEARAALSDPAGE